MLAVSSSCLLMVDWNQLLPIFISFRYLVYFLFFRRAPFVIILFFLLSYVDPLRLFNYNKLLTSLHWLYPSIIKIQI